MNCNNTSSTYGNTVCLQDWWLIKAEKEIDGKILAIEGLTLREQRAVRVFSSAPIIKRYDLFTLKTADGITIMIKGFINKSRTLENGFSLKVCNDFLLGFPYYWEDYAGELFEKNFVGGGVPASISGFNELNQLTMPSSVHQCLGGIAATKTRDHLISNPGASENSMLIKSIHADVLEKCYQPDSENPSVPISADSSSPVMGDSSQWGTPSNKGKCKSELNREGLLHATDEEAAESEDKIIQNEKDNLCHEACYEPESKVLKESSFKDEVRNFTDDTPVQEKSNSDRNHEDAEVLSHATAEETVENEDRLVLNKYDNLNCDSCNEPERGLKEISFKEKLGDFTDDIPVLQVNAEVFKSSDVELLATIEPLVGRQDGEIDEETLKNEGNLLSNKQDNDGCNEPESEVLKESFSKEEVEIFTDKISVPHLNAEVVGSFDIESLATKKTLSDKEDGVTVALLNTSKRITRNSLKKLRNYDSASGEHSNLTGFDAKLFPSMVGKGVPAEKISISKGSKKSGNTRHGKVRVVGSLKSKCTKLCFLVPQECEADKVSLIEGTVSAGGNSSFPNMSFDGSMEKHASTSPTHGVSKFSSKLRKCNDVIVKDDTSKNLSIPKTSDANDANPSKGNMVVTVDLKSTSRRMRSSKNSRKDSNKTKGSLKGEGSANVSASYDTGKDDSSKDASASRESDIRNAFVSEVNISVPVGISTNYTTTFSKVRGRPKKNNDHSKRKELNGHSVSGSQGYKDVPGLHVEEKLSRGSGVGIDGILEESLLTTPHVGISKIAERAGNSRCRTMEDSTAQGQLESNVNCSTKEGIDTLNVTPKKGAATKTSDMLTNVEGKGNTNTAANCCSENENNDPTSTPEAFEKPGRKKLIGTSASNSSGPKIDILKGTVSSCEGRRSSSRLKNLKRKEDQTTNSRLECKRNKVNTFLVRSDFVKSDADSADGELGGKIALDQPNVGLQATVPRKTIDSESKDGSQTNCMLSSVITGAIEKANCTSAIDGAESSEQSKSFISSIRLGDVKQTGDAEMSKEREESEGNKLGTPGRKTKKKFVPPSPITRNRRIDISLFTPEHASYRRSRSGRLLVPPVDFWRNQKVVYDMDGWIAGVQNGLSVVDSSTGGKSEPPNTKRKLV